jgi:hypothetical protein
MRSIRFDGKICQQGAHLVGLEAVHGAAVERGIKSTE